nr:hypothetical protein [uncultured Mucilaginibacter sp.]
MKKIFLLGAVALLFAACESKTPTAETTAAAAPVYPYKIKHPDNWLIDTSSANTMTALNALKSYETMDTVLMKKCFADSVTFNYDGGTFKSTGSNLIKMVKEGSADTKSVKIDVKDWEAVTGKDLKEEWVTVWYTQHMTDMKGKTDSTEYVNDFQFVNGKIVKLNEYLRHFKK